MNTAEAVEKITDTAQFEILAIRVLRELEPDCRSLIHFGMNTGGKTVPGPVDGFCLVPGSQPHRYIAAACTVTGLNNLRNKWLFDHKEPGKRKNTSEKDDGDLVKGATNMEPIRAADPSAQFFVVYLCTNRLPEKELVTDAISKGSSLNMEVRFLEQSRLRDFLDTNAQGQWLRQEHLGIDADTLLQKLTRGSLEGYIAETMLTSKEHVVPTRAAISVSEEMQNAQATLHLLLGPSGAGKSIVGYEILRCFIGHGRVGFWIPGEAAESAMSLSEAVEKVLRSLHPTLSAGAGACALAIATTDDPIVLIFDDINRTESPARILTKILGWSRLANQPQEKSQFVSALRLVCPLWNIHWFPKQAALEQSPWLRVHLVGPMQRSESIACLKKSLGASAGQYTDAEFDQFAERMGDDAILLGLFGRMLHEDQSQNSLTLAADVIGSFVDAS